MTNSNQLRAPRTVFQGDILTYFITQTNKNHFLINQTYSPLLYAVSINSFDLVRDLIVNLKCDTNVTHSCHLNFEKYNHLNLFMTNAYQTCTSKEELLKERIAIEACDFNSTEIHFYSPLMLAVKNNNYQMCELLLNYNADVSCLYANGKKSCGLPSASSLSLAISSNNLDLVKLLIKYNANINERLWLFGTPYTHMFTYLSTAKKMCEHENPNSILETFADLYDYLVKKEIKLTHGDFYLIFQEIAFLKYASKTHSCFVNDSVIVLIKLLSIMKFNQIEKSNMWLNKIVIKIITIFFDKEQPEKLFFILELIKIGGFIGIVELRSIISSELKIGDDTEDTLNKHLKNEPLRLKQICRLSIKSSLKYFTKPEIMKLNLPNCLKNYLYFFES